MNNRAGKLGKPGKTVSSSDKTHSGHPRTVKAMSRIDPTINPTKNQTLVTSSNRLLGKKEEGKYTEERRLAMLDTCRAGLAGAVFQPNSNNRHVISHE